MAHPLASRYFGPSGKQNLPQPSKMIGKHAVARMMLRMGNEPNTSLDEASVAMGVFECVEARAWRFFDLLSRLPEDDDVELIHDIRVFSRRLSEGLAVMRPAITSPSVDVIGEWLSSTRSALGPVRDADVMRQLLGEMADRKRGLSRFPAVVTFAEELGRQRTPRLIRARETLSQAVVEDRGAQVERLLARSVNRAVSPAALEGDLSRRLRRRVRRRRKAFLQLARQAAGSGRGKDLHAARIAGKKIRYALELADESGVLDATAEIKQFRLIQDTLGRLNDLTVLRRRVVAFCKRSRPELRTGRRRFVARIKKRRSREIARFVADWPKTRRCLRKAKARRGRKNLSE